MGGEMNNPKEEKKQKGTSVGQSLNHKKSIASNRVFKIHMLFTQENQAHEKSRGELIL